MTQLDTVPAYYRAHFNAPASEIDMLKLKLHNPANTPDEFISAAWIAHNEAMKHKAPLLGSGDKPVIGAAYSAPYRVQPAIYRPAPKQAVTKAVIKDALAVIGAIGVFAFFASVGSAVFL